MASTKLMTTKDGKRFYKISVSRGYGVSPYTMRWYVPAGWSNNKVEKELPKVAAAFELRCSKGEILSRAEQKEAAASDAAERAKLKTFKSYALDVYMATKEQSFSENARSSYMMFLENHIFPVFGEILLVEINTAMVNKFLLDFQKKGYAQATVTKLYNILNGIFKMAFMDDSIPTNPMLKVVKPKISKEEKTQQLIAEAEKAFTAEQLQYILSCVAKEPLKWQAYINLAADTGARRGELCALQWSDIDFNTGIIQIRRNLQYTPAAGIYETTPKNGKPREIDIGTDAISLLRRLRAEQASTCISKWVFTQNGTADPMHPQSPTRYFSKLGKKYEIMGFHPHKLRHTNASLAVTNNADIVSVSARLGHSDSSVTFRMYAHANPESIRRAGQAVRDALKNA